MRLIHAELALSLPGRPAVRRELLRFDDAHRVVTLRPDGTRAHVTLETNASYLVASLAGPEQADIEVHWLVEGSSMHALPLWAMARGGDAEVALWDAFGRLAVPDVLARGVDAANIELAAGRYVLTATAFGDTTVLVGAGVSAQALHAHHVRNAAS